MSGHAILLGVFLLDLIAFGQLFIATAGQWNGLPQYTDDYRRLAEGFRRGQLSLSTLPPAKMLALSDPYDPAQNAKYRLHDAVLFNGKYYLYWGPVPALILAAVTALPGMARAQIGDESLVIPCLLGTTILATLLIFQIRQRLFPRQPLWTLALPVLSLGLGTPVLFTLARAAVYEAAIGAGQFFLLAGIFSAWRGLLCRPASAVWLTAAGICWMLSFGSRVSLAPATGALAGLVLWRIWRLDRRARPGAATVGLLAPLAAGALLTGWYNYARFGSITEFGLQYQLAFHNQHGKFASEFSSPSYVLVNLHRYLLIPPHLLETFPFFMANGGARPFWAARMRLPASFGFEAVVGLIWSQPFLLLAFVAAAAPWCRRFSAVAASPPDPPLARWLTAAVGAAAVLGFAPALLVKGSTMRYLLDGVPCFTLLAAMGFGWALSLAGDRARGWIACAAATLVAEQCVLGLLLGISGYYGHFSSFNPRLFHAMQGFFGHG